MGEREDKRERGRRNEREETKEEKRKRLIERGGVASKTLIEKERIEILR